MSLAEEYCDKCGKLHLIAYCPNTKEYNPTDSTVDNALLVTPTTFADI